MPFKINISEKGKTYKLETEKEDIVGKKVGDKIKGDEISEDLKEYELQITGASDKTGHPAKAGLEGPSYHRQLLKKGFGMKDNRKGIRLRKALRGEEISLETSQINLKILKQGKKKFKELLNPKESEKEKESAPKKSEDLNNQ